MNLRHQAPDGGLCYVIKGPAHGLVRTFDTVVWESTGPTCPTPGSPGHFDCFACGATHVPGTGIDAWWHAATCRPRE